MLAQEKGNRSIYGGTSIRWHTAQWWKSMNLARSQRMKLNQSTQTKGRHYECFIHRKTLENGSIYNNKHQKLLGQRAPPKRVTDRVQGNIYNTGFLQDRRLPVAMVSCIGIYWTVCLKYNMCYMPAHSKIKPEVLSSQDTINKFFFIPACSLQ